MNSQLKEVLVYRGKEFPMACEPLDQYFSTMKSPLRFFPKFKNNARGYLGKWAVIKNELHLIDFIGVLENKTEIFLENLFPGKQTVFADWFTDEISMTQGKLLTLKSRHSPAIYERELHLEFRTGRLVNTFTVENTLDTISGYVDNSKFYSDTVLLAF